MAGDDQRLALQRRVTLPLQHPQHCQRVGHQRRLGVLGQDQFLGRPLEHQLRQLLLQGLVDLLEHFPRGGEGGCQIPAHTNRLAALAWEDERIDRHGSESLGSYGLVG